MRDALERLVEYGRDGRSRFMNDVRTQDAILRRLQIVGEAARRLPEQFRTKHHQIPWRDIAAFRDVVVHHYDRLDLDRVWDLVDQEVAALLDKVTKLLARLGERR